MIKAESGISKVEILFFGLSLLLASCGSTETEDSTNVAQDRIYQSFQVDYKADTEEMKWLSSYAFGGSTGTTLELRGGSTTSVNGNAQDKVTDSFDGTFYRRTEKTKFFVGPHKFSFKDSEGKKFTNTVVVNYAKFPSNFPTSFSKKEGVVVVWDGLPLSNDERVFLDIRAQEKETTVSGLESRPGSTKISLHPKVLEQLPVGMVEVQLIRYFRKNLSEATSVGGHISYNYYSVTKTIKVTE